MPRPVLAFPCGSKSITSTRLWTAARAVARLIAVVVLPTPPFWFATARIRWCRGSRGCSSAVSAAGALGGRSSMSGTKPLHSQYMAGRIGQTSQDLCLHYPTRRGRGQFIAHALPLEEETNGGFALEWQTPSQQLR